MNTGFINGFPLNGAAYPSWVVRAAVVAVAVATVAVAPTRFTFAHAFGDAAVSVTLTQTHTIQARASGSAGSSVNVEPTLQYAGFSYAAATATGNGAVRRDVFATAGGDATCYAEALTAQALAEAVATMGSTVIDCAAHIVHPGRSLTPCEATGEAAGDVTRYPVALAGYGQVEFARGEASVKRNGTSFYEHDGYVLNATSTATSEIPQDRVKIIATLGSFDYGDSTGSATPFVKQTARSSATGYNTAVAAAGVLTHRPTAAAVGTANATATATRAAEPAATAEAGATHLTIKARVNHASHAIGTAEATVTATGVRMTIGDAQGIAQASVATGILFGTQHFANGTGSSTGASNATAKQKHLAWATTTAELGAVGVLPTWIQAGRVNDAMATALVGSAKAVTNSEVKAPDDRYMRVPEEARDMIVYAEERTMVVTA